jgi:hypothetical protein
MVAPVSLPARTTVLDVVSDLTTVRPTVGP